MKEQEDLLALMFSPENRQKTRERMSHARNFFYDTLLPKIREADIKTTKDLYDTLEEYRDLHDTDVSIAYIFPPARMSMIHVISQRQLGIAPLDLFEVDLAFSLIRDAIIKDDRFYSESEHGIKPNIEVLEIIRSAVKKISRDIELKKANLRISPA